MHEGIIKYYIVIFFKNSFQRINPKDFLSLQNIIKWISLKHNPLFKIRVEKIINVKYRNKEKKYKNNR